MTRELKIIWRVNGTHCINVPKGFEEIVYETFQRYGASGEFEGFVTDAVKGTPFFQGTCEVIAVNPAARSLIVRAQGHTDSNKEARKGTLYPVNGNDIDVVKFFERIKYGFGQKVRNSKELDPFSLFYSYFALLTDIKPDKKGRIEFSFEDLPEGYHCYIGLPSAKALYDFLVDVANRGDRGLINIASAEESGPRFHWVIDM